MKKVILFLLTIGLLSFVSCGGDSESVSIEEYIAANNLTTQQTASGLHYIIENPGSGASPALSSFLNINYKGYLLNGEVFDSGNDVTFSFPMTNLILGWQEGLQLIGTGGRIILIIPANLAYGSSGSGSIPPNAPIAFDIDLLSFR